MRPRPIDLLRDRLDARDCHPRGNGDQFTARCPAHEDSEPSLSVGVGDDDRAVMRCHAGCENGDVLAVLGLEWSDLYADRQSSNGNGAAGGFSVAALAYFRERAISPGVAARAGVEERPPERLCFPCVDADGKPSERRRDVKTGGKTLGRKGRTLGISFLAGEPAAGETVLACEGESDALAALSALDGVADAPRVALVPGASFPPRRLAERFGQLGVREALLAFDGDDAGRKATAKTTEALQAAGIAVRVVTLADGEDIASTLASLDAGDRTAWLTAALRDAEPTAPAAGRTAPPARRQIVLRRASDVPPQRPLWLWKRRLPIGALSLIAGEPGLGKSTFTVELAARTTRGELEGELRGQPRDVLLASAEDALATVIIPRLMAARADLVRVHNIELTVDGEPGELTLPDDVAALEQRCVELAAAGNPVALVSVDPVGAYISASTDSHRDASVRRVLAPLVELAERQALVVLAVAHLNKGNAQQLLNRVGGSVAFGAAPRSVLAFARDPEDPDGSAGARRVIVHAKSNHGMPARTLAAHIESCDVPGVGSAARLVIGAEVDISAEDLTGGSDDSSARDVEEAVLAAVADGPQPSAQVKVSVATAMLCSRRTVERAAVRLERGKMLVIEPQGFPRRTMWRLPNGDSRSSDSGSTASRSASSDTGVSLLQSAATPERRSVATTTATVATGNESGGSPSSDTPTDVRANGVATAAAATRVATDNRRATGDTCATCGGLLTDVNGTPTCFGCAATNRAEGGAS